MPGYKSNFTKEEDAIIVSYLKKADENPDATYKAMYPIIADELNRDVQKVINRANTLKKYLKKNSLSDKEMLLVKLRSIKKDQENVDSKVNYYKNKFNALKREHESLKKEYNKLKKEYDDIMSVLQEVLNEDSEKDID